EVGIALKQRLHHLPHLRNCRHRGNLLGPSVGLTSVTIMRCTPSYFLATVCAISTIRARLKPLLPVLISYTHTVLFLAFSRTSMRIDCFPSTPSCMAFASETSELKS